MATKWRDRVTVTAWLLLFTFGLNGASLFLVRTPYADQATLLGYVVCSIVALLVSGMLHKRVALLDYLNNPYWKQYFRAIPIDLNIGITCVLGVVTVFCLSHTNPASRFDPVLDAKGLVICTLLVAATILQSYSVLRTMQNRDERWVAWNRSVIHILTSGVRESFRNKGNGMQVVLLLGIVFASGFGLMVVFVSPNKPPTIFIYILLFAVFTIPALVTVHRRTNHLERLVAHTSALAKGNSEPDLVIQGHSMFATLAQNINLLKHGVETSQAAEAKSERFKTELITSVSHDLRTPLTSIINYTELLKDPSLTNESRNAYVNIIDQKSKRLKVLIEDLFEASKIASGSIELVKEQVDIGQLLDQAIAEREEMIRASTLQFRIAKPEGPVYCVADGGRLWRVFDNLIGNILKYSLESTRVFIIVQSTADNIILSFKNISKHELSESIDELFERFKRGDASRHTEGSGLGLTIAKSIVDLHGGSLELVVDGDLFKAIVTLKKSGH